MAETPTQPKSTNVGKAYEMIRLLRTKVKETEVANMYLSKLYSEELEQNHILTEQIEKMAFQMADLRTQLKKASQIDEVK